MPVKTTATTARATRLRRFSAAGIVTAGAAAAALSMAPTASADEQGSLSASAASVSAASITDQAQSQPSSEKKADKADKEETKQEKLDGWIHEALDIMKKKDIPGSYEGLHKNIMRESGGDPNVSNDWDVNAQNGTPSKGLLQVIEPTFDAYHVKGTPDDLTDPVANITAAANYAADRYGSIDNVDSAY